MRHLGRFVVLLIAGVNLLFTGMLLCAAYSPYIQPVEHPVWSCLGLAFPVFLLVNGLFLLFWVVVRQYRYALLPLAGFLLCLSQIRTYFPLHFQSDEVPEESIKVLSYNIMGFGIQAKEDKENPVLAYLKASGADILCLQEYATGRTARHPSQKEVERALADYPYHHIGVVGENKANRIACYSKLPILSARPVKYASASNGSWLYELAWGKDTLLVINNHLESNKLTHEDKEVYEDMLSDPGKEKVKSGAHLLGGKLAEASALRAPQADAIAREIGRSSHQYIVVCGDFNDSPISYAHRVIGEQQEDAFADSGCGLGISYNRNKFYFRIDHILNSPALKAWHCRVDRSIRASDHYPIVCSLSREMEEGKK